MKALVIGATGLIGRAVVNDLVHRGHSIHLHYHRDCEGVEVLAGELRAKGRLLGRVQADLRDADATVNLVDGLDELDLLVFAAGGYRSAPLSDTDAALVDEMLSLNLRAPLLAVRATAPLLADARGQAILLGDIAGEQAWRDHAAYAASKAGLAHLVRCLALELAPRVRVNGVAPGLVVGAEGATGDRFEELQKRIPARRAVAPQEVADAVVMLAEGPTPITGQLLAVDGGRRLGRSGPLG